jgi:hypothetical protein
MRSAEDTSLRNSWAVFSRGWRGSIDNVLCSTKKEVPRMGCSGYLPSFLMLISPGRLVLLYGMEELCKPIYPT